MVVYKCLSCTTVNITAMIIPTEIRRLRVSEEFPMDMRLPPLEIKILPVSDPLKCQNLSREIGRNPAKSYLDAEFQRTEMTAYRT